MGFFSRGGDHPDADELRSIAMFAELSDEELAEVAKLAEHHEVAAGDTIIDQGRFGESFYVIETGHAAVYMGDTFISTVGEGSAIGEMALLERRPRNATVTAETDMLLAKFDIKAFHKLLERYPTANLRINELLNRRLRENIERED